MLGFREALILYCQPMPESAPTAPPASVNDDARLAPLFIAIVFVEAITIASLYWFGRHFS